MIEKCEIYFFYSFWFENWVILKQFLDDDGARYIPNNETFGHIINEYQAKVYFIIYKKNIF